MADNYDGVVRDKCFKKPRFAFFERVAALLLWLWAPDLLFDWLIFPRYSRVIADRASGGKGVRFAYVPRFPITNRIHKISDSGTISEFEFWVMF